MKWNLDGAFPPISTDRYKQRKLAVQLLANAAVSSDYTAPVVRTGVHADAQYLLELETIAQGLKHGEVFRCEKCESSEIWLF